MTDSHPITPPLKLAMQWFLEAKAMPVNQWVADVATQAARWGADQELEACCEFLDDDLYPDTAFLRAYRRSRCISLKEKSIALVDSIQRGDGPWSLNDLNVIRRALESLPD